MDEEKLLCMECEQTFEDPEGEIKKLPPEERLCEECDTYNYY